VRVGVGAEGLPLEAEVGVAEMIDVFDDDGLGLGGEVDLGVVVAGVGLVEDEHFVDPDFDAVVVVGDQAVLAGFGGADEAVPAGAELVADVGGAGLDPAEVDVGVDAGEDAVLEVAPVLWRRASTVACGRGDESLCLGQGWAGA
jgi:hypothetical protein